MDARELEFEVAIDFLRGTGDASRIFRAMGGIVEALQSLDRHLIQMIDGGLSASVLLDDVSAGSIRAFMRSIISELPDEALEKADWRGLLGHFLVKAKYLILAWCDAKVDIITRDDVEKLTRLIDQEAVNTQVKAIPAYAGIRVADVLRDIQAIQQSVAVLDEQDKVVFRSVYGVVRLKSRVDVSPELVREVLTRNVVTSNSITLIRVKKPDYLGRSQWSFQYAGHRIDASIRDREWLGRFQARLEDVRPGDSLRVDLAQEIYYGYEGEVVHQQYAIDHVIEVVRPEAWAQADAFDDE